MIPPDDEVLSNEQPESFSYLVFALDAWMTCWLGCVRMTKWLPELTLGRFVSVDIIDDPRYRHSVTGSDGPQDLHCTSIVHGPGLVGPRMTVTPRLWPWVSQDYVYVLRTCYGARKHGVSIILYWVLATPGSARHRLSACHHFFSHPLSFARHPEIALISPPMFW